MAYEPAINTTQGEVDIVKHALEQVMEIASVNRVAIIGFIVNPEGSAEPFASSRLAILSPKEFKKFIGILTDAMQKE